MVKVFYFRCVGSRGERIFDSATNRGHVSGKDDPWSAFNRARINETGVSSMPDDEAILWSPCLGLKFKRVMIYWKTQPNVV